MIVAQQRKRSEQRGLIDSWQLLFQICKTENPGILPQNGFPNEQPDRRNPHPSLF
jgi:hypothetical protein